MLQLASISFNVPWCVAEQIRLLLKNLDDEFAVTVYDNSTDAQAAQQIGAICEGAGVPYVRLATGGVHHEALNFAARELLAGDAEQIGFLDHDVFPSRPTMLGPLIDEAGFYGIGQRHAPTGRRYLFPGFCFFTRSWLNGRELDFSGIRGGSKREDGDTGSGLWPLFEEEGWERMYRGEHGYRTIREPDSDGLQSWGIEVYNGAWLHLTNASSWMAVARPEERERLLRELVAAL